MPWTRTTPPAESLTTMSPLTVNPARRECGRATRASQGAMTYSRSSCPPATSPAATWEEVILAGAVSNCTNATDEPRNLNGAVQPLVPRWGKEGLGASGDQLKFLSLIVIEGTHGNWD